MSFLVICDVCICALATQITPHLKEVPDDSTVSDLCAMTLFVQHKGTQTQQLYCLTSKNEFNKGVYYFGETLAL